VRKKIAIGTLLGLITLFLLYTQLGSKGFFKIYNIPSSGCSPAMNPGDYIVVSNLSPAKRNDLIVFLRNDSMLGISYFGSRLIAKEKDTIEMIGAKVFVNGKNIDTNLRLKHSYVLNGKQFYKYRRLAKDEYPEVYPIGNDNYFCNIEDDLILDIDPSLQPIDYSMKENTEKWHLYRKDWNIDNFGPYIIPDNTFFVMGDNRHNSLDSRSYGPISEQYYVGKVINKNK